MSTKLTQVCVAVFYNSLHCVYTACICRDAKELAELRGYADYVGSGFIQCRVVPKHIEISDIPDDVEDVNS